MNLVFLWFFQFMQKHYRFEPAELVVNSKVYFGATFTMDLREYLGMMAPLPMTVKVTREVVNNFCGREKYFRKCLKEGHGADIVLIGNYYTFKCSEDFAAFISVAYVFFLQRDTDGFVYRTEKGEIPC